MHQNVAVSPLGYIEGAIGHCRVGEKGDLTMRNILWALLGAFAVCSVPSARGQWPGSTHPWQVRAGTPPVGGFSAGGFTSVPRGWVLAPPVVPGIREPENRRDGKGAWFNTPYLHPLVIMRPTPEFDFNATKFSRDIAIFQGRKGGFLAVIGGTIVALFSGIFGRKKES
jgi:hypothetical protein